MRTNLQTVSRVLALLLLGGCNYVNRADFLAGNFGEVDKSAPVLASPPNGSRITPQAVTSLAFSWAKRAGIGEYRLEIATVPDFSQVVKSVVVRDVEYAVTAELAQQLQDNDFYWRVRSSDSQFSSAFHFSVENANYIFVDINTTSSGRSGTKGQPLTSINEAIALAVGTRDLFSPAKTREVRVAQGTYSSETVNLFSGVKVTGGFQSSSWIQNASLYKSTIKAPSSAGAAVTISGVQSAIISDFEILNDNTINAATGVSVYSSNLVEILNSTIRGGGAPGFDPKGISVTSSGKVTIQNCTVTGGLANSGSNYGIYAQFVTQLIIDSSVVRPTTAQGTLGPVGIFVAWSYADIERSTIYGGNNSDTTQTNRAIHLEYSTAKINANTIYSADPDSNDASIQANSKAIELDTGAPWDDAAFLGNQAVVITNNLILVTYARTLAQGIGIAGSSGACALRRIHAISNTFVMKNTAIPTSNQVGINIVDANRCWEIRDNLIYAESASATGYSRGIMDPGSTNLQAVHNNLIAGAATALYYRGATTINDTNLDGNLDPELTAGGVSAGITSGNRWTNQASAILFVSPVTADYHLGATSAGLTIGENLYGVATYGPINDDREGLTRPSTGSWTAGAFK